MGDNWDERAQLMPLPEQLSKVLLLVGDGGRGGAEAGDARGVRGGGWRGRVCHVPPRRHDCQLQLLLSLLPARDLKPTRLGARPDRGGVVVAG